VQKTLARDAILSGPGLHSGVPARLVVRPAPADHGVVFLRTDVPASVGRISATWDHVVASRLCTLLANPAGTTVSTIEHLMAALAGCAIHNALIEIDGPEVPILDGSSAPFVEAFLAAGIVDLNAPVRALKVLKPVEVRDGLATARLEPADTMEIDFRIEFEEPAIGEQELSLNLANGTFVRELSDSRTFCRWSDVEAMRANGLALGGTLENAVVFDRDRVVTPGGLRRDNEPVRHKMLDALGDLSLSGGPIIGRYVGDRAGHALTNRLLRALFARPDAYVWIDCGDTTTCKLPGVGVVAADLPISYSA